MFNATVHVQLRDRPKGDNFNFFAQWYAVTARGHSWCAPTWHALIIVAVA